MDRLELLWCSLVQLRLQTSAAGEQLMPHGQPHCQAVSDTDTVDP